MSCHPSKISIVSPSVSFTIAFFQLRTAPGRLRRRGAASRARCAVQTPVTFTPNSHSIACRIAALLASGRTSNVYSPRVLIRRRGLLGHDRPDDGSVESRHRLLPLLLGSRLLGRRLLGRGLRGGLRLAAGLLRLGAGFFAAAFAFTAAFFGCRLAGFAARLRPSAARFGLARDVTARTFTRRQLASPPPAPSRGRSRPTRSSTTSDQRM